MMGQLRLKPQPLGHALFPFVVIDLSIEKFRRSGKVFKQRTYLVSGRG